MAEVEKAAIFGFFFFFFLFLSFFLLFFITEREREKEKRNNARPSFRPRFLTRERRRAAIEENKRSIKFKKSIEIQSSRGRGEKSIFFERRRKNPRVSFFLFFSGLNASEAATPP